MNLKPYYKNANETTYRKLGLSMHKSTLPSDNGQQIKGAYGDSYVIYTHLRY